MSTTKTMLWSLVGTLVLAAPAVAQENAPPPQRGQPTQPMQEAPRARGPQTQQREPMQQQPMAQRQRQARPTRTIQNLRAAIQGEANAAHRYDLFAQRADEEGHQQVAKLFRAAAVSERIHRRNHEEVLRRLGENIPQVQPEHVTVATTRENIMIPIRGERQEAGEMYPEYIRIAEEENVPGAVESFTAARDTEAVHDQLFQRALSQLGQNPPTDYYVQTETGMVVTRSPATVATAPRGQPEQRGMAEGTRG